MVRWGYEMMNLIGAIIISLLLPLAISVYYAGEDLKKVNRFEDKIKSISTASAQE